MGRTALALVVACSASWASSSCLAAGWQLDEQPASANEWGFRPVDGSTVRVTPPGFVWRPQEAAVRYRLQVARDRQFTSPEYVAEGITLGCHCPPRTFAAGQWYWRFQAENAQGQTSDWSSVRTFTIAESATEMPLPMRADLLARVPAAHPRLFLRPDDLPRLRQVANGELADAYRAMVRKCDRLLKNPPPTAEPSKYPEGTVRGSDAWREIWWGNREYVIRVFDSAATLAFVHRLGGQEEYGQLAKRLLLEAARWDPHGATGYRYNDEAGMPYAYGLARTYTLVNDLLTEDERQLCREVAKVRGEEMYAHLHGVFPWRPYNSHANRAWHFLGEVGVAFLGEVPEAEEWAWFAVNVFHCSYPVWCDDDGGWHEGLAYWRSYMHRFTWWADVMESAFALDAYRKPFFAQIGYFPMYVQPPGTKGGGFGDLAGELDSSGNAALMRLFAAQADNGYWQWYAEAHGPGRPENDFVGFIRRATTNVTPRPPTALPSARCFHGIGIAAMNTNLLDGRQNVELLFKSSPSGGVSHGYDASNAFMLYVFGTPLFISTGRRDMYGSAHHKNWMWETKSTNCITVNGAGQVPHSREGAGRIVDWSTSADFDYVAGDAGTAYGDRLTRFTRHILFVKPELVVIYDDLAAPAPSTFEWWLHSPVKMDVRDGQRVRVTRESSACDVTFLAPQRLSLTQTDQFDPPPRPRIKLTEYHLTAATPTPQESCAFITVLRPGRADAASPGDARLEHVDGGWIITAPLSTGQVRVLLNEHAGTPIGHGDLRTTQSVAAVRLDPAGAVTGRFEAGS